MSVWGCVWDAVICFKQRTAYEMRISDGSSDVCSSGLAESANLLRERGDLDGQSIVLGGETGEQLVNYGLVFGDQAALGLALGRIAEGIEKCGAQEAQLRQQAEAGQHPGAEFPLARLPGIGIGLRQDRRGGVEFELEVGIG